jgi:hypothetical protein
MSGNDRPGSLARALGPVLLVLRKRAYSFRAWLKFINSMVGFRHSKALSKASLLATIKPSCAARG